MKKAMPYFVAFVLLLCLTALTTYWWLTLKRGQVNPEPVVAAPSGNAVARSVATDMAPLARLMGSSIGSDVGNVRLQGIIASGEKGVALLSQDSAPTRAIVVGQEMVPGLTLAEVRADGVVINRNGARQELRMPPRPVATGITTGVSHPSTKQ